MRIYLCKKGGELLFKIPQSCQYCIALRKLNVQKMHHSSSVDSKKTLTSDQQFSITYRLHENSDNLPFLWNCLSFCLYRVRKATMGHKERVNEEKLDSLDQRSGMKVHMHVCIHKWHELRKK